MKNLAASVKARLLNIARKEGRDFNRILLLYMQERFIARLSESDYQDRFILKGGVFLYLRYGTLARPTVDLDLLGRALTPDLNLIAEMMSEIARIALQDGVVFDSDSVRASRIREEAIYEGVRVKLSGHLETARLPLQIDVGFGDAFAASPEELRFPTLLNAGDAPSPTVLAYAIETVVAEKFQAMTVLGTLNSRFKDFYDIYIISREEALDAVTVLTAIERTFERRKTPKESSHYLFEPTFAAAKALHLGWARLRAANPTLGAPADFSIVMARISAFLKPVMTGTATGIWRPERSIWQA